MKECCNTCKNYMSLEHWTYHAGGGVTHVDNGDKCCTAFAKERTIIHMDGDGHHPDTDTCECYKNRIEDTNK